MKHSLTAQVAEVERAINEFKANAATLVWKGHMRQSEAEMHLEILRTVRDTLDWLRMKELAVREAVKTHGDHDKW